jgi:hypothetical protein
MGRNHFGFDWLRREYVKEGNSSCVKEANIDSINYNIVKDVIERLKKEYTSFVLNDDYYYVPKLTMYHRHQENVDYITDEQKRLVKLQVKLENARYLQDNDTIQFRLPENVTIEFEEEAKLDVSNEDAERRVTINSPKQLHNKHITIFQGGKGDNTKPLDKDCSIEVYNGAEAKLIGKLDISANNEIIMSPFGEETNRIEPKIEYFEIIFSGSLTRNGTTFTFNSGNETIAITGNGVSSTLSSLNTKWKHWIYKNENLTKSMLHQCLIDYKPDYNKFDDVTQQIKNRIRIHFDNTNELYIDDKRVDSGEFEVENAKNFLDAFVAGISELRTSDNRIESQPITNKPIMVFNNYSAMVNNFCNIINVCKDSKTRHFITIVICPLICGAETEGNRYAGATSQDGYTILRGHPELTWLNDSWTLAHEIGHGFGMRHTFPESEHSVNKYESDKKFVFNKGATENIMDYTSLNYNIEKYSFWKWQKDIAAETWKKLTKQEQ